MEAGQERQATAKATLRLQTSAGKEDERSTSWGCGFAPPPQSGPRPPSTNSGTKFLKGHGQHLSRINNEASGGCMSDMLEDFVGLRVPPAGGLACFSNGYLQHAMKDPQIPRTSHRHVALICVPICPGFGRIFNLRVAERHNSKGAMGVTGVEGALS